MQGAVSAWVELLRPNCPDGVIVALQRDLGPSVARLSESPLRQLNILFIGDCIQFEVITALLGPCGLRGSGSTRPC